MKFAWKIFTHQDFYRFLLKLTVSGSTIRLWEFDQMGATTSVPSDIHQNGLLFVKILLSFLWINDKQLAFNSDLMEVDGKRFVKINRIGKEEQLIITKTLRDYAACSAAQATTCWKAYQEGDDLKQPLVVKEYWQYVNWPEEGEFICKTATVGVAKISQYYHHEMVMFNGKENYVCSNVRNGISITAGSNLFTKPDVFSPKTTTPNKSDSSSKAARSSGEFHLPGIIKTHCTSLFGSVNQQSQTCQKSSQVRSRHQN